jgi:hypothetical protein
MENVKIYEIVEYLVKETNEVFTAKVYGLDFVQRKIYLTFDFHSKDPILKHNFNFDDIVILRKDRRSLTIVYAKIQKDFSLTNTAFFKAYAEIEKDLNSTNITL